MQTLTEELLRRELRDVITDVEIAQLLGFPSSDRRHALVKRALASGDLVRIRRGVYVMAEPFRRRPLHLASLAAHIYGRSYVSLESALAEHGWIPERVAVLTCGTFQRSRSFDTPVGRFEFRHTPFRTLAGVHRVEIGAPDAYLLASPLRALADLAHARPAVRPEATFLVESLRIERQALGGLRRRDFTALEAEAANGRAVRFLRRLREELGR